MYCKNFSKDIKISLLNSKNCIKSPFGGLGATFGDLGADFSLELDYHFGGYAKSKPELALFMENFTQKHKIPLEFVYTGKLFWALKELCQSNYFPRNKSVMVLHTGGLRPW